MSKTVKSNGTATTPTVTLADSIACVVQDPEYGPMFTMKQSRKGVPAELDRFPFRFGPGKARLILAHIEALKQFVAANPGK